MKSLKKKSSNLLIVFFIIFYVVVVLAVLAFQFGSIYNTTQDLAKSVKDSGQYRIDSRIAATLNLVTSLAKDEAIVGDGVANREKARILNGYSASLGYYLVCYVDENMRVWDEDNDNPVSLSNREYMQKLFETGEPQVVDVMLAGADGKTPQYTIAAPIKKAGIVNGAVFASLYFEEINSFIQSLTEETQTSVIMFGSTTQVMHYSNIETRNGDLYVTIAQEMTLMGATSKEVEENMLNGKPGSHWEWDAGKLYYVEYLPIESTSWTLMARVGFDTVLQKNALGFSMSLVVATILSGALFAVVALFYKRRMETVNMLLQSIEQLEKQIYQNENPNDMDFKQIITMTGKGLTDGLTGVVTRTVFMDRVSARIQQKRPGTMSALAFIDVDDLKKINDTYGHETGDEALKEIGYTLRKYEKRYDGMVGRYGGDEFVVYLNGFATTDEVSEVIDEMTSALKTTVTVGSEALKIQCSIGATVCGDDLSAALKEADEALYFVKRNGKGGFKLV